MDVLDIAKQRRANLARELSRLDEFIRMGEELSRGAQGSSGGERREDSGHASAGGSGHTSSGPSGGPSGSPSATTIREFSAGTAKSG